MIHALLEGPSAPPSAPETLAESWRFQLEKKE